MTTPDQAQLTSPEPAHPGSASSTNRILASLPPAEAAYFLPQLTPVTLRHGDLLYQAGLPIPHVYFPLTALVSLLIVLQDGRQVEMAAVGREGMVGLPLVLGVETDGHTAMDQIPGAAFQLPTDAFQNALAAMPGLQQLLGRYAMVLLTQSGQAAACNGLHAINERCARWLLEAQDRVGSDTFLLTQDFLAAMLGVRRPSVTVAAGMLQQAGLIRYHRGRVTILDRAQLKAASCECYGFIMGETDRLLGSVADHPSAPQR